MTVFRSNLGIKFPQALIFTNKSDYLLKTHVNFLLSFHNRNYPKSRNPICCALKSDEKTQFFDEIEKNSDRVPIESDPDEKYDNELEVAVKAVHIACLLCQKVQENLIFNGDDDDVQAKDDNSPVTIADWSVQATVSWILSQAFGAENVSIVAEEDIEALSKANAVSLLSSVTKTVNNSLSSASLFGIKPPLTSLETTQVLEAISRCNSSGGPTGRFWVLDPVDGTLGFVRGDQYAIALALVEDGQVVLGVLGCPNYPMNKECLNYQNVYRRIRSSSESRDNKGCVLYAKKGSHKAWMQPLLSGDKSFVWPNSERPVNVSTVDNPVLATFCEPVEKANSSHSFTQGLAHSVGLRYKFFDLSQTS